jgi:hypothetical protein
MLSLVIALPGNRFEQKREEGEGISRPANKDIKLENKPADVQTGPAGFSLAHMRFVNGCSLN